MLTKSVPPEVEPTVKKYPSGIPVAALQDMFPKVETSVVWVKVASQLGGLATTCVALKLST